MEVFTLFEGWWRRMQERPASYYILDGWVYACPPLQRLLDTRLLHISHFMLKALAACCKHFSFRFLTWHKAHLMLKVIGCMLQALLFQALPAPSCTSP